MSGMPRVDVWISAEADVTPALLDAYRAWLSPDEARQSQRFLREADRQRYLLTRGLARGVLADYTGEAPPALAFAAQVFGKPVLRAAAGAPPPPHFNLSHTCGLVVLAVCREAEVGVDVEAIDRSLDPLRLAARHFSPSERAALAAATDAQRHERFFELWTLKEAYAKALGQGLNLDLQSFSVVLDAAQPRIVEHAADGNRSSACQCRLHVPLPGYRLALVVRDAAAGIEVSLARGLPLRQFTPVPYEEGQPGMSGNGVRVPYREPSSVGIRHSDPVLGRWE
jgi:4'-phosphopantetheinyl transferase